MPSDECDASAALVFLVGLIAGTGCAICSKSIFQMRSVGLSGQPEDFMPPLFQTWVMFVGMSFALPAHFVAEWHRKLQARDSPGELLKIEAEESKVGLRTYVALIVPSLFDLIATVLMVIGLMYVNASVWMLLRGGGIVFVALMKHFFLSDTLQPAMWIGVFLIAAAVLLVAVSDRISAAEEGDEFDEVASSFGVAITIAGTFVQSMQYVYEEKVMSAEVSAPPWLLIGVEGVTGALICTFILYPMFWLLPGSDHGSLENPINTLTMLANNRTLLGVTFLFCALCFVLNAVSVLITYMMSAVWHAILDNCRPVSIWVFQLTLYYGLSKGYFGEPWDTGSELQLAGLLLLIFGTAVYNGAVQIPGVDGDSLLFADSPRSSPALSRSPLITMNRASPPLTAGGSASPYVQRLAAAQQSDQPMELHGHTLGQRLVARSEVPLRRNYSQ